MCQSPSNPLQSHTKAIITPPKLRILNQKQSQRPQLTPAPCLKRQTLRIDDLADIRGDSSYIYPTLMSFNTASLFAAFMTTFAGLISM